MDYAALAVRLVSAIVLLAAALDSVGLIAALSAAAASIVTLLLTKGVEAVLKLRKSKLEEQQYEDDEARRAYAMLFAELTARVQSLDNDLRAVQMRELKCIESQAKLEGRDELRAKELELLRAEVAELRKWRNEQANQDQIAVATAAAEKTKAASG